MANVITTLLKMDSTQFKTGMSAAQQSIKQTDGVVAKAKAGWSTMFSSFASSPVAIGAATAAVGTFAAASVSAASDLNESINAVNVTFGESADKILKFGENAAKSAGLAQSEFNQLATPLGSILKNAGFGLDEVADKTITLTQRAADMASVFNTDVGDALGAIQAGLRGEQDPLEKFGVGLSAAKVEARALADTGKDNAKQLTDQEKQLARIELILDQTNQTAGDFAETSGDLANQTRTLNAEFKNLQAAAGQELIPILSDLATAIQFVADTAVIAKDALEGIPGMKGFNPFKGGIGAAVDIVHKLGDEWKGESEAADDAGDASRAAATDIKAAGDAAQGATTGVTALGDAVEGSVTQINAADQAWQDYIGTFNAEGIPGTFEELKDAVDSAIPSVEELADAAKDAADQAMTELAQAVGAVGDALDAAFGDLEGDLGALDLLDDITEQFGKVEEAQKKATDPQGVRDLNREVRKLQGQLLDYLRTVDDIPPDKVTDIIAKIRTGDIDTLRTTLDEITKDRFVNIGIAQKGIPLFQSVNANFTPAGVPGAPVFNGQSAIPSQPFTDARTIINNYPVGSTPTTQFVDSQIDARRNGSSRFS